MKTIFPFILVLVLLISCSRINREIEEAKEARKTTDSLLNEFEKVNRSLDSANRAAESVNDSFYEKLADTSLSH